MATQERAQISFAENELQDETLYAALEDWADAKEIKREPVKTFNGINRTVKAPIERKELSDGEYRCGRYVITIGTPEAKYIEFERASKQVVRIKVPKN